MSGAGESKSFTPCNAKFALKNTLTNGPSVVNPAKDQSVSESQSAMDSHHTHSHTIQENVRHSQIHAAFGEKERSNMNFVKGQKVRCIEKIALPEGKWPPIVGGIYTIKYIDYNDCLTFENFKGVWKPRYFEAVPTVEELRESRVDIRTFGSQIVQDLEESEAIPIRFESSQNKVFLAAESGPPLKVRQWTAADMENQHIAMEVQNLTHTGENEDPLMRLCMHLQDASQLAAQLIDALAKSGDPMGKCLLKVIQGEPVATPIAVHDAVPAICDLKQSWNSTKYYFSFSWNDHTDQKKPIGDAKDRHYFRIRDLTIENTNDVERVLRIIRKYAELFNLLIINLTDHHQALSEYPWRNILSPFCKTS